MKEQYELLTLLLMEEVTSDKDDGVGLEPFAAIFKALAVWTSYVTDVSSGRTRTTPTVPYYTYHVVDISLQLIKALQIIGRSGHGHGGSLVLVMSGLIDRTLSQTY